jgi:hypothetical protein
MKRFLSLALCLILGLSCMTLASAAASADLAAEVAINDPPPPTRMAYTHQTITQISISGGKAICVGTLTGYQSITTKVEITLTLQRKLASSSTWSDFYNHPKQTFNDYRGTANFSRDIVKGYQYRTKAVYTAWSGTKSETFTEYSGAMSY